MLVARLRSSLECHIKQSKKHGDDEKQLDAEQGLVKGCIDFWEAPSRSLPKTERAHGEPDEQKTAAQERPHYPMPTHKRAF